jgi:hypothetical protein
MIPKFRAWIKKDKEMIDVDDLLVIDYDLTQIMTQQVFFERGLAVERDIKYYDFEDIELMQSTGLFDKHNKEIFEGDIVLVLDSPYTVFYDIEKGSYRLKPHDDRWNVDYMSNFSHGGNFEVIGNIYENPELLEVK